ncbi:peptide ABC transporter substrate-binding protein [Clostridium thermarum]|uniref:peptide ABC transporter substrate-binding protein n=1 Tax=Clostridium thermarum TaxID=1716543 RepID=UPI0013D8AA30|nr:peptide ABC transporter substrate-binding protein [Clostridium thermarum]
MKKRKLLTVLMAAALSVTVFMTGCGKKGGGETTPSPIAGETPGSETPGQEEIKLDADQTINVIGYDFKTLDPSLISDSESFTTLTNVYECLVRESVEDGVVVNKMAGAESFEVSEDGTVYTYKLRKEAKWSDGQPVTAKDYEYSWKRLIDPRTAADYMTFLEEIGVKGASEVIAAAEKGDAAIDEALANLGVKAIDEYTFQVTLAQPTPAFESAVAFKCLAPIREDLVKAQGDSFGNDPATMVYNGPFVVSEYAKGSKIVYKKNPNYWNADSVKLETAIGHIINETATIVKMFEGKELDVAGASGDDLTRLKKLAEQGEYQYITGTDTTAFFNYFNVERPVIKNAKVRRALSASADRQQFLNVVFKRNIPSWGIVPAGMQVSGKDYRALVEEPLKSVKIDDVKALFMEGLKEEGITDPSKLKIELLNGPATTRSKAIAEYWQKTWKDTFGFELVLNFAVDAQTYFKERQAGNFDIVSGGWGADYNDASSFFGVFISSNPNNNGNYNNPKYDELVLAAAKELDADKRVQLYKEAETLLIVEDAAVLPTYYADIHQFRQNYVKGFYIPKFGGYYDLSETYISGKE